MKIKFFGSLFLSLILVHFLFSCSSESPQGKTPAENLFKDAQDLKSKKRYLQAIEKLNQIKSQYPYSYYATPADLMLADISFEQENYVEAAGHYSLFKEFHPKHPESSYVTWRLGESYFLQMPSTFDRDLTPAIQALTHYRDLISLYPDSAHVNEAKQRIQECQSLLKQKDIYIAEFYFKTKVYESARYRFMDLIKKYKSDADLMKLARIKILESTFNLKQFKKCKVYVRKFENYSPDEKYQSEINDWNQKCGAKS